MALRFDDSSPSGGLSLDALAAAVSSAAAS
jgi:hypothetical protein